MDGRSALLRHVECEVIVAAPHMGNDAKRLPGYTLPHVETAPEAVLGPSSPTPSWRQPSLPWPLRQSSYPTGHSQAVPVIMDDAFGAATAGALHSTVSAAVF